MEKAIVAVEENHHTTDSPVSAAKSSGNLVQINSIEIDLQSGPVEQVIPPEHEHFSIRGYVAAMRKKDRKLCTPFPTLPGEEANLPPLSVPSYRWWNCIDCVPEIGTGRITGEMVVAEIEEAPAPITNSGNENNAEIGDEDVTSDKHGSESQGYVSEGRITVNSNENGGQSKDKLTVRPSLELIEVNPHPSQEENVIPENVSEVVPSRTNINQHPPVEVDGDDSPLAGNNRNRPIILYKRKPKLRLLAEIMENEMITTPLHVRKTAKSASSSGVHAASISAPNLEAEEVGKGSQTSQKKRKATPEEARVPQTGSASFATKKLRTLRVDAESSSRAVEVSDRESGKGKAAALDLQIGSKPQQSKMRKNKLFELCRRKQAHNGAESSSRVPSQDVPKINTPASLYSQKFGTSSSSASKFLHQHSMSAQMEDYIKNFKSQQKNHRSYELLKNQRPEVRVNHNPVTGPSSTRTLERSTKETMTLDLSLNSFTGSEKHDRNLVAESQIVQQRSVPIRAQQKKGLEWDLNEKIIAQTSTMQQQQFPTLGTLPFQRTLDISASGSRHKAGEGQGYPAIPRLQNGQPTDKRIELGGASDDIPMDIVELMAKNQHERASSSSGKYLSPEMTNNTIRGFPALRGNIFPAMANFPPPNMRTGINIANNKIGTSIDFSQIKYSQLEERRTWAGPYPQNRQSQTQASGGITMARSRQGGSGLVWNPMADNVPFRVNVPQKSTIQPGNIGIHLSLDQQHKGRTISDLKDGDMSRQGNVEPSRKPVASLDPYSNETIPALQLLSLMDKQMTSGSSYDMGLENPLCGLSPPPGFNNSKVSPPPVFNNNKVPPPPGFDNSGNQTFIGRSFFLHESHPSEFSASRSRLSGPGESLKSLSAASIRQMSTEAKEKEKSGTLQKSEYAKGALLASRDSSSGMDKQKGILSALGSNAIPQQPRRNENSSRIIDLEPSRDVVTPQLASRNLNIEMCSTNRNPAEFSIPEARNEFTISAKDLKLRKRSYSRARSSSTNNSVGRKRQNVSKSAGRDH